MKNASQVTVIARNSSFVVDTRRLCVNDEGAITGPYNTSSSAPPGVTHGYVRDPEGNITPFDPPGSISTNAQSINAGGAVTGSYRESNNVSHGYVRRADGKLISFDPPGSISTGPASINAKGAITGSYRDANNRTHGFVRRPGGEIVSFDVPESAGTLPIGINNAGAIMGQYDANGRSFGFVRDPHGKFTSFDPGINHQTAENHEGEDKANMVCCPCACSRMSGELSGFSRDSAQRHGSRFQRA